MTVWSCTDGFICGMSRNHPIMYLKSEGGYNRPFNGLVGDTWLAADGRPIWSANRLIAQIGSSIDCLSLQQLQTDESILHHNQRTEMMQKNCRWRFELFDGLCHLILTLHHPNLARWCNPKPFMLFGWAIQFWPLCFEPPLWSSPAYCVITHLSPWVLRLIWKEPTQFFFFF